MSNEALVLVNGNAAGRRIPLDGKISIGRSPENHLQLEDLLVSRRHALIEQTERGTILRDLASGNGTFVSGRKIIEYRLSPNDVIRIGNQEMRFERSGTPALLGKKDPDSGVRFDMEEGGRVEAANAEQVYKTFFQPGREQQTQDQLKRTEARLQVIYAANEIIASERDLGRIFERVIEQVFKLLPAHNGVILLFDKLTGQLNPEYVKAGEQTEVKISSSIVSRAAQQQEAVLTYDASGDQRFGAGASIISQNIASAMCVPLTHQTETLGVIYVDTRGTTNAFVQQDLELLVALAAPAAIAIKNAQYLRMLEQAYQDTLQALSNAIEMRDHYTVGHTWRVTNFAVEIAREMGWDEEKLREVKMGGVLHDIGKIAVDDAILRKPDRLTEQEYDKMKIHPERGAGLLRDIAFLQPLIPYALYHHEHVNGGGYPYGLKGEEIPIEGRVIAVADVLDALTSNRPYRKGMPPEKAIMEIIVPASGTQFDPQCVDALLRVYKAGKIDRILQDYFSKDEKSIACPYCSTFIRPPEGTALGMEFDCSVCHRRMRLSQQNDAYFGELLPHSGHHTPLLSQPRNISRIVT